MGDPRFGGGMEAGKVNIPDFRYCSCGHPKVGGFSRKCKNCGGNVPRFIREKS